MLVLQARYNAIKRSQNRHSCPDCRVRIHIVYGRILIHASPHPVSGVRTSLVVCFVLHTACRLAMAVTTSRHVMLAVLLGPETVAGALGVPVLTIGIKRFTTQARPRKRHLLRPWWGEVQPCR